MVRKGVVLLVALMLPALAHAGGENPWETKLPFKKATIEYSLSGMEKGTEMLYIRDYGKETAKYRTSMMNMMGMKQATETAEFVDPDWIYTYDLLEGTGVKAVNPQKLMIEEYNKLSKKEKDQVLNNSEKMSAGPLLGGITPDIEKNAVTIHGYSCDKVGIMGVTTYSIHETGLPLKTESNMMGMKILAEAVKVEEGASPEQYFKHPEGITAVVDPEADAMSRTMAKETMAMLKDPDAAEKMKNRPTPMSPQQQEMTPEEQQQMEQAMEAMKSIFGN
jgi:hypothetical protein